jgi:hypothetical protein
MSGPADLCLFPDGRDQPRPKLFLGMWHDNMARMDGVLKNMV